MIKFEKEVCEYLQIPSIPRKEWNEKDSFKKGVAVVRLAVSGTGYAVCTYDEDNDVEPRIIKSFASEPFYEIENVFVVPNYMNTSEKDISEMDLDDESKKKAEQLVQEAQELTATNEENKEIEEMQQLPEWIFPEITNAEEARAWLQSWNSKNKVRGKIPTNEETIKMRLLNIYSQMKK
jgi:hypothetical protein